MADEITTTVNLSVTNPSSVTIGHNKSSVKFDQATAKADVHKTSQEVGTSYEVVELGDVTVANAPFVAITNCSTVAGNYLVITFDGANAALRIPPGATNLITPDITVTDANFKLKFATAADVAEVSAAESNE